MEEEAKAAPQPQQVLQRLLENTTTLLQETEALATAPPSPRIAEVIETRITPWVESCTRTLASAVPPGAVATHPVLVRSEMASTELLWLRAAAAVLALLHGVKSLLQRHGPQVLPFARRRDVQVAMDKCAAVLERDWAMAASVVRARLASPTAMAGPELMAECFDPATDLRYVAYLERALQE